MENDLKKARIIKNGVLIEVYPHKERGTWINFSDCKTEYKKEELDFKNVN